MNVISLSLSLSFFRSVVSASLSLTDSPDLDLDLDLDLDQTLAVHRAVATAGLQIIITGCRGHCGHSRTGGGGGSLALARVQRSALGPRVDDADRPIVMTREQLGVHA